MKKLLYLLFLSFALTITSCTSCKNSDDTAAYGSVNTKMIGKQTTKTSKTELSRTEFNAFCLTDSLPNNLNDWEDLSARDYETRNPIRIYFYTVGNSGDIATKTYKVQLKISGRDTTFVVTRRKITTH